MITDIFNYYKEDMPSPESFKQEVCIWREFWEHRENINICSVPKHYESFKSACTPQHDLKHNRKSQLPILFYKKELNSLHLLYVHKDISLDCADNVNDYARRNPRTT